MILHSDTPTAAERSMHGELARLAADPVADRMRAQAARDGARGGRPRALSAARERQVYRRRSKGESAARLAVEFGISRRTVSRIFDRISAGR